MLAVVSPLRSSSNNDEQIREHGEIGNFYMLDHEFSDGALLDDFNFDDILLGFDEGDVLPGLEVDPAEILAEFSAGEDQEDSEETDSTRTTMIPKEAIAPQESTIRTPFEEEEEKNKKKNEFLSCQGEEVMSEMKNKEEFPTVVVLRETTTRSTSPETDRSRKTSSTLAAKGSQSKRKVKVDWTPELHRRFVQAVEQLGVDKAVPSRILELMGIDCLTRHNIASHLQKYRSHRKHLLAREAEAASWSQRRQMYANSGTGIKREMNPWIAPTIGFPRHPPPPSAPPMVQPFRPLHVWGHPTAVEPPLVHMWPRHIAPRSPTPPWAPQAPSADHSYWHHHYPRVPHGVSQGTPCFPQPLLTARFPAPPVPGILPHPTMYRQVPPIISKQTSSQSQIDAHPSKESIDAAIGDVLEKPWLPLPLGLKPPSLDSVLGELHKQGISKVPPLST